MKRIFCIAVVLSIAGGALLLAQSAGEDYTKALQKKGMEQVRAFEEYIKKYPDTSATFTKYAYYWIAVGFYNQKNYTEAVARAEKSLQVGVPEKCNEATLFLVIANAYGVKDSPKYNKDLAVKYADKSIEAARAAEACGDVLKNAESLKKGLSGAEAAPKKPASNLDKMKLAYNQKNWGEVAGIYNSLPDNDKKNPDYLEVYALSLYQQKRYDVAIQMLNETYTRSKKSVYAYLLGQMYAEKAKKDKNLLDAAADFYAQASLLYGKEGKNDQKKVSLDLAKFQIGEKYDYNARAAKVNATVKTLPKPVDNTKEIEKLQREHDKLQRDLERKYADIEMPDYEQAKLDTIMTKIENLKKASEPKPSDPKIAEELEKLKKDEVKINDELKAVVDKARTKLGM